MLSSGHNKMWAHNNFISTNWPHCEPQHSSFDMEMRSKVCELWARCRVCATHRECHRSPWRFPTVAGGHAKGHWLPGSSQEYITVLISSDVTHQLNTGTTVSVEREGEVKKIVFLGAFSQLSLMTQAGGVMMWCNTTHTVPSHGQC